MVIAAVIDAIGGKIFGWPLPGSTEITGLLQVVAIAGGLVYSKINGKQINVGFLIDSVKGRKKATLEVICSLLALGFFVIASWMLFDYGLALVGRGTGTFLLGVPLYPFVFWVAVACCIPMCLVLIMDIVRTVAGRDSTESRAH